MRTAGDQVFGQLTKSFTPYRRAARTIRRASGRLVAMGFSVSM